MLIGVMSMLVGKQKYNTASIVVKCDLHKNVILLCVYCENDYHMYSICEKRDFTAEFYTSVIV